MRELRPEDYEKLAQHVVDAFLADDAPLADGVTKAAMELELNPHQIRNLTQLSNVTAHLKLFEKKAEDKVIEFVPVDPADIIQSMFKGITHEKTASDGSYDHALDFYGDFVTANVCAPQEKLAEIPQDEKPTRHPHQRSKMILRLQKVAEELDTQRIQNAQSYVEELDKLAAEFAKLYGPDIGSFEKDAVARYGELAVPTINDIRTCLRMDGISMNTVDAMNKTARVVDDETPEMRSLAQLIKFAAQTANCAHSLEYLRAKVRSAS